MSKLQSKTALVHLILLHRSPLQQMNISRYIYFLLNIPCTERPLLTMEDMEVIVRRVKAGVSFGAEWGAEYDEVFSDGGVDDVHGTHGTASVVEHPFLGVGVESDDAGGVGFGEVGNDVVDHVICVIGSCCGGDRFLGEFVKVFGGEDIPPVL